MIADVKTLGIFLKMLRIGNGHVFHDPIAANVQDAKQRIVTSYCDLALAETTEEVLQAIDPYVSCVEIFEGTRKVAL